MANLVHITTATKILEDSTVCKLKVIRLHEPNAGEILTYNNAVCTTHNWRKGTFNVKLLNSGQVRTFRAVSLIEINDMEVYL